MLPVQRQCKVKEWLLSSVMHVGYNVYVNVGHVYASASQKHFVSNLAGW